MKIKQIKETVSWAQYVKEFKDNLANNGKLNIQKYDSTNQTIFHALLMDNDDLFISLLEKCPIPGTTSISDQQQGSQIGYNTKNKSGFTPLHIAVKEEKTSVVEKLLEQQEIKVNEQNADYMTPLHLAVISGNIKLVKKLLEHKDTEPNLQDKDGMTPLHYAVVNGHVDIVNMLLDQKGIEVNVKNLNSQIAKELSGANEQIESLFILRELNDKNAKNKMLLAAVGKGHWLVVKKLLDKRVNEVPNSQLKNILIKAIDAGQVDVVKLYLSDVNKQKQGFFSRFFGSNPMSQMVDKQGMTLLHHATKSGNKEIIEMLVETDKNVTKQGIFSRLFGSKSMKLKTDKKGKTALDYAKENKNWDIAETLLSNDIKTSEPAALLASAVKDGKAKLVDLILEKFETKKLFFIDANGKTALDYACEYGKWDIAQSLFNKNILPNVPHLTLIEAVKGGQSELVQKFLVRFKLEVMNVMDADGKTAFDYACENGKWVIAKNLLEQGISTNEPHLRLIEAVKAGEGKLVKIFFENFELNELNVADGDGKTALDYACENNEWNIAKDLLEKNITTNEPDTLLISAVKAGEGKLVKTFLERFELKEMNIFDADGKTALDYACEHNEWDIAKDLLENAISTKNPQSLLFSAMKAQKTDLIEQLFIRLDEKELGQLDKNGATILHHAVNFGHKNVVEKILEIAKKSEKRGILSFLNGSQSLITMKDKDGMSALDYANNTKNWTLVEYLLAQGATSTKLQDILMSAAQDGQDKIISLLTGKIKEFNPNIKDAEGNTALHYAVINGHENAVKAILSTKGINPDIQDAENSTALHYASYYNNAQMIDILLSKGASINIQDENGATPLHDATRKGNHNAANKLLAHGDIEIDRQDNLGMTALHYAVHYSKAELLDKLLACGADINISDNDGNTALRMAIKDGKFDIAKAILKNPNIELEKHNAGETLLQLVVKANNNAENDKDKQKTLEVIKLLVEAGYDPEHKIKVDGKETTLLSQVKDQKTKTYLEEVIAAAKDVSIDDLKKDSETSKDKNSKAIKNSIKEVEEYNNKYRISKLFTKPVEVTQEAKVSFAAKVVSSKHSSQGQSKGRGE